MKNTIVSLTAAALFLPATPALAQSDGYGDFAAPVANFLRIGDDDWDDDDDDRYYKPRRLKRGDRYWRDRNGRYRCKRDDGTTGLIIGGAVGALLGREIDGGRDRTVGTVLGAAGGALLGREIDRGELRCR
ncbi:glycine zipper 2TM domain-containing protein [Parasphingorhabdus cellanae]|uniref:17 kDa surface antigen n=1 Tax=Parasphingorhabdus cellanae TaxID=2806553 RepID=A0ABX7T1Q1_9SPHN|nr:glycine zipper 2TM domain-containing protein [Parasphingorhabdus cellanae]QTD55489.1 glycine zipper 2TM domain-containing protein [Parasphingorhabdus cellanae]